MKYPNSSSCGTQDLLFKNPSDISTVRLVMQNWQHIALQSTSNSQHHHTIQHISNKAVHKEEGIISWTVSTYTGYKPSKEGRDCVSERNRTVSSIGSDENSPVANVS